MEDSDSSQLNSRSKGKMGAPSNSFILCVEVLIWVLSCLFFKERYVVDKTFCLDHFC